MVEEYLEQAEKALEEGNVVEAIIAQKTFRLLLGTGEEISLKEEDLLRRCAALYTGIGALIEQNPHQPSN